MVVPSEIRKGHSEAIGFGKPESQRRPEQNVPNHLEAVVNTSPNDPQIQIEVESALKRLTRFTNHEAQGRTIKDDIIDFVGWWERTNTLMKSHQAEPGKIGRLRNALARLSLEPLSIGYMNDQQYRLLVNELIANLPKIAKQVKYFIEHKPTEAAQVGIEDTLMAIKEFVGPEHGNALNEVQIELAALRVIAEREEQSKVVR